MLDYIAMGMVLDEALTGYDIRREIETGIGNFYKASYGSLYPALKKLAGKGYLTMSEQLHGNRVKKYYEATALGKGAFLEWLSAPFDLRSGSDSLLARIYFFGVLPEDVRKQQLQAYELYYQQMLRKLQTLEQRFSASLADGDGREYFELSTLYLGLQHLQDSLRWFKHIGTQKPLSEFLRTDFDLKGTLNHDSD